MSNKWSKSRNLISGLDETIKNLNLDTHDPLYRFFGELSCYWFNRWVNE